MTRLRFLGQAGLRLELGGTVLYVDPCLSDYVAEVAEQPDLWQRRFAPPISPDDITAATAVLCSHEHADHFDPRTLGPIAAACSEAVFVVPAVAEQLARKELGDDAHVVLAKGNGEKFTFGPFAVFAVPAAHSTNYTVEPTDLGHRWLGYVIEVDGYRIYHAGDTVRHQQQIDAVAAFGAPDIALLPINGRDEYRDSLGLVGNLWPREAAEMALELQAGALVPLHHDLFAFNGISAGTLVDYVQSRNLTLEVRVLAAGAEIEVHRGGSEL